MTMNSPYPRSVRDGGVIARTDKYEPALLEAIRTYQVWHKQKYGFKPSRSNMFATSLLQHNDTIRHAYLKIRKGEAKKYGRKCIDGVWTRTSAGIPNEPWDDI